MKFVKTQFQFILLTNINIGTTLLIILARHLFTLLSSYVYISSTCVCKLLCIYICVSNKKLTIIYTRARAVFYNIRSVHQELVSSPKSRGMSRWPSFSCTMWSMAALISGVRWFRQSPARPEGGQKHSLLYWRIILGLVTVTRIVILAYHSRASYCKPLWGKIIVSG